MYFKGIKPALLYFNARPDGSQYFLMNDLMWNVLISVLLAERTSLGLGRTRCRRKNIRLGVMKIDFWIVQRRWRLGPCLAAAAAPAASSLAFLAASMAAILASCSSLRAFHSLRLLRRRSSMGVICTWKRLNSWHQNRTSHVMITLLNVGTELW